MLRTREFWVIVGVGALIIGFLAAAASTLINFDTAHEELLQRQNLNVFLIFNILMLFIFDGFFALGEIFNYFRRQEARHSAETARAGLVHHRHAGARNRRADAGQGFLRLGPRAAARIAAIPPRFALAFLQ